MKQLLVLHFLIVQCLLSHSQNTIEQALANRLSTNAVKPETVKKDFIGCGLAKSYADTPIYIIDGVPADYKEVKNLNPNEIESIELLKESSLRIISCRQVKDVVIITTGNSMVRKIQIKDFHQLTAIPGATIILKKTNPAVSDTKTTNQFGVLHYKISQSNIDSVFVSSVGYQTVSLTLQQLKQNKYQVFLKRKEKELDEVIVTGYSNCSRKRFVCDGAFCNFTGCKLHSSKEDFLLKQSNSIKIFPNPVLTGGTMHINFISAKPGIYQIHLVNAAGQLLYNFQKQITFANETELIHLQQRISAGIYFVQVLNEKKEIVQSKKVLIH
jgi:Secretion system C-terminal sorting domain